ncbi:DUF3383 family protein [Pseudomonas brenneri]|uniref:DUF3383 family protein n=1 Tax=Pseudomonas brenneri TaxID=129817 RepID=UPI0025A30537|nr:DUF3383 family protein [Pseudomonas brenneri]WJM94073.1 DUF3383 family protein [Pseudomonas brenneri]
MSSVPISEYINVGIALAPTPQGLAGFGKLLVVSKTAKDGTDPITLDERIRQYSSMAAVAADYADGTEINKAATAYYAQVPRPVYFMVGLIDGTNTAAKATGSNTPSLAALQAVTAGGFTMTIDGVLTVITAVDLSGATSFAAAATLVQTKLNAQKPGTTCTYNGTHFVITSPTTGVTSTITVASSDVGGLAAALGMLAALIQGQASETPAQALTECEQVDNSFYGIVLDKEFDDTQAAYDAAVWAQARTKKFFNTTNDPVCLTNANSLTFVGKMKDAALSNTLSTYAPVAGSYAGASVAGRAFTVNFEGTNTTITLMYKKLPSVPVAHIKPGQNKNLNNINCNVFLDVAGNYFFAESKMADGSWFDTRHGLDWLQNRIETDVFNLMYRTNTKVEYTDTGVSKVIQRTEYGLRQGVTNGLIAPGYTSDGEYLELGYRIDYIPVGDVSSADKGNREYKGISFKAVGAGAIHKVTITGSFSE